MLRTMLLVMGIIFCPGLFLLLWAHNNYNYEPGTAYDLALLIGNCLWDLLLVYLIYRGLRFLCRLFIRLVCWLCRILWEQVTKLYYYCRARADRRGDE